MMRRVFLPPFVATFAAFVLSGCVPAGSPAESPNEPVGGFTTELPDTPAIALLRHVLDEHFEARPANVKTVCATILSDEATPKALPESVETALIERYPELAPYDRCVWKDGQIVDSITGESARLYQVHSLECVASEDCTGMAGWISANLGAEYDQYRVHKGLAGWRFDKTGLAVMS